MAPTDTSTAKTQNPQMTELHLILLRAEKKRLIAGFLLSGMPQRHLEQIMRTLQPDVSYPKPIRTSWILDIMRHLTKLQLLDFNGFPRHLFDQRGIYKTYGTQYSEKIKAAETVEAVETSGAGSAAGKTGETGATEPVGNGGKVFLKIF